jgi:hypothetical protein
MDSICVYCMGLMWSDNISCYTCNEYDGVMLLEDAVSYLEISLDELQELA